MIFMNFDFLKYEILQEKKFKKKSGKHDIFDFCYWNIQFKKVIYMKIYQSNIEKYFQIIFFIQ